MTNLLCKIGWHKWRAVSGTERIQYESKWISYEYARGKCTRCVEQQEIRREL